jgi:hypothetical protein
MAKILTDTQNDHPIKIKRMKTKTNPKMLVNDFGFGIGALNKGGMVYDPRLDAVRIGNACIPMSNVAEFEIEE